MVNVASTREALCNDFVGLGKQPPNSPTPPPHGAIGLSHRKPTADGTFTEATQRKSVIWGAPSSDGVVVGQPLRFSPGAGVYQFMLFFQDEESDVLIDYCELIGAELDDDSDTLVVTPRYTQS